jgi:hypothetical protein
MEELVGLTPGISGRKGRVEAKMVHLALCELSLEPEGFEEKNPLLSF